MNKKETPRRSDAINYLLQAKLSFSARYGMPLLGSLSLLVFLGLYFVKVPESAEGNFTLSSSSPPVALISKVNARVREKYVANKSLVRPGQALLLLENLASDEEVRLLAADLDRLETQIGRDAFDSIVKISENSYKRLGEIQATYEIFKKANNELYLAVSDRQYRQLRAIVDERSSSLDQLHANLQKQEALYEKELHIAGENYEADSLLYSAGNLSRAELKNSESVKLQKHLSLIGTQREILNNRSQRNDIREQLMTLERGMEQQKNTFLQQFRALKTSLNEWKDKFLISAGVNGVAQFNRSVHEGLNVQAGETILYIVSPRNEYRCELLLPQNKFGKIKKGQRVILKFDSYQVEEYGTVEGFVQNISELPQEVKMQEGARNFYLVQIGLKNGLITSHHKIIKPYFGLSGKASILLDDKSLLTRIFLDRISALL